MPWIQILAKNEDNSLHTNQVANKASAYHQFQYHEATKSISTLLWIEY